MDSDNENDVPHHSRYDQWKAGVEGETKEAKNEQVNQLHIRIKFLYVQ
jgi:hypothetical protein